jgi:hypothetical protein
MRKYQYAEPFADSREIMKRFSQEQKGYDCLHAPCLHEPKGNHGIHGGAWFFAVASGDKAVSLKVLTSFYPETVPPAHRICGWPRVKDRITGVLVFHRAVDHGGEQCDFLAPRRCETDIGGYLVCDEFAPLLAETLEPQSEAFWTKLETSLDRWGEASESEGAANPVPRKTETPTQEIGELSNPKSTTEA